MRYRVETLGVRSSAFILKHVLVIGPKQLVEPVLEKIRQTPELGLLAVGAIVPASDAPAPGTPFHGAPLLGHYEVAASMVRRTQVEEVLVPTDGVTRLTRELADLVEVLKTAGVKVHTVQCTEMGRKPAAEDTALDAEFALQTGALLAD